MMSFYKHGSNVRGSKGFTLIELLVVIAIIGILASIVLASLGAARNKGSDAAVKGDMDSARPQAEIFASGGSYAGVCTAAGTANGLLDIMKAALSHAGVAGPVNAGAGAYNKVTCHDSAAGWAAEAPLKASASAAPVMWCVDSNGSATSSNGTLAASAVGC